MKALSEHRNRDAAEAFEASYRLEQLPRALLNLGIAYTKLGRTRQALEALDAYVAYADPETDAQNILAVRNEIMRLRASLPAVPRRSPPPSAAVETPPAASISEPALEPLVAATAEQLEPTPEADASRCAFDDVCVGPVVALGIPNVIGGGLTLRFGDHLGAQIGFQVLPTIAIFDLGSVGSSLFSVDARVYPFGGSFFVSAGFGYQSIHGTVDNGTISAEASAQLPSFLLGIGFLGHEGFVVGVDLALLIPLSSRSAELRDIAGGAPSAATEEQVAQARQDAKTAVEDFVDFLPVLVQLNVLRIGYVF